MTLAALFVPLGRSAIARSARRAGLALALAAGLAGACSTAPPGTPVIDEEEAKLPPKPKTLCVTSSFGGTHRVTKIEGGVWYQSFENRVLLLDSQTGSEIIDLELAPRGTTGVVSDFLVDGTRLLAVLEDDWVMELDVTNVPATKAIARWGRAQLGIRPRWISSVGGQIFVSGDGGVVRLADAKPERDAVKEGEDDEDAGVSSGAAAPPPRPVPMLEGRSVGSVVAAKGGPVACVGRRIVRVADGQFLGSASRLIELPAEAGGGYGFVRQSNEGAEVGLMDEDFRERSSSAMRGVVHSIRFFDDRFFAVNDFEVATWKVVPRPAGEKSAGAADKPSGSAKTDFILGALLSVPVKGARDIAKVERNRFAVAGSFGRSLYRYLPEGDRPGDTFYWSKRLPGRLDVSVTDQRRILAASREGAWMYLIGEEAELSDAPIASPDRPLAAADTAWGSARITESRDSVVFRIADQVRVYTLPDGELASGLCIADGKVWIGHSRGIDVIGFDPATKETVFEARVRLSGPMVALYPNRVGGGVSYVSAFSGFGVVRPVDQDAPPVATRGTRSVFLPVVRKDGEGGKGRKSR